MQNFYAISSQHHTARAVIDDCLRQLENAPGNASFGFIYATDVMANEYEALLQACRKKTGIQHWIGSLGMGVIASNRELYDMPAASIMLAEFDEREFSVVPLIRQSSEIADTLNMPHEFATSFGVIHGDPFNQDSQNMIRNLQVHLSNGFLVGGLTSSQSLQYQIADRVCSGGISGVIFSENVGVLTNLSQGCRPFGAKHEITQAQDNVVFTLERIPALEVLMQDLGVESPEEFENHDTNIFVGLCVPGSDVSDYTVRNLVGVDLDHRIFAINDYLVEGNELVFCRRDRNSAVEDLQHMLSTMASRLTQRPRGGLYISCMARGRNQFGDASEEVKMIHEVLGDFPMTGFFANGEIHHDKLYGYTGVLTLFT